MIPPTVGPIAVARVNRDLHELFGRFGDPRFGPELQILPFARLAPIGPNFDKYGATAPVLGARFTSMKIVSFRDYAGAFSHTAVFSWSRVKSKLVPRELSCFFSRRSRNSADARFPYRNRIKTPSFRTMGLAFERRADAPNC